MPEDLKYYFIENGHLTEEGVALYVDKFRESKLSSLPDHIILHVESCQQCKTQILEINSLLQKTQKGEFDIRRKAKKKHLWTYISIAASILLLIAVAAFLFIDTKKAPDPEKLFAQYFTPYPDVITTKNSNINSREKFLLSGLTYYSSGNMDSALLYFQAVDKVHPDYSYAKFYEGISLLSLNMNIERSIQSFEIASVNEQLEDQCSWYLALAFIKLKDPPKAEDYLSKLCGSESSYKEKATKLLKQLD